MERPRRPSASQRRPMSSYEQCPISIKAVLGWLDGKRSRCHTAGRSSISIGSYMTKHAGLMSHVLAAPTF